MDERNRLARLKLTKLGNSEIYALVRIARTSVTHDQTAEWMVAIHEGATQSDGVIDVVRHTKLTHVICIIRVLP